MERHKILVINPGSTSTKVAVFYEEEKRCEKTLEHGKEELEAYQLVSEQFSMRRKAVLDYLDEIGEKPEEFSVFACRGASFGSMEGGAYLIDETLNGIAENPPSNHAGFLATRIGYELSRKYNVPAYLYDAVTVDELDEVARLSGTPGLPRIPAVHTLNAKAAARKAAAQIGKRYEDSSMIVCHMGGGISTSMHVNGRIVDFFADDEGTFSPERAGRVPCIDLVKLCFGGAYDQREVIRLLKGGGGLSAYLGTSDAREVERRIAGGDAYAEEVYYAMAYQISKDIAAMSAVVSGKTDAVVLTGGLAYSELLTGWVKERVGFLAPVQLIPGTLEMEALAGGVLRVLRGEEEYHLFDIRRRRR